MFERIWVAICPSSSKKALHRSATSIPHLVLFTAAMVMALTACASDTPLVTGTAAGGQTPFTFGEPADSASADRVIEITSTDDFRFDPAQITVQVGETVTFRVVNAGNEVHDFTLGDETTQIEHAEEMTEMSGMTMPDEPNAITIAAGETKEITWRFTQAGVVLIGCHQPGHYENGMKGSISVQA